MALLLRNLLYYMTKPIFMRKRIGYSAIGGIDMKKSLLNAIVIPLALFLSVGGARTSKNVVSEPLIMAPQRASAAKEKSFLVFTHDEGNDAQPILKEDFGSGKWSVSPVSTSADTGYEWRDIPKATVFTLQRQTAIKHITKIRVSISRWSNSWGGTDEGGKYAALNAKLYIGNTLIAQESVTDDSDLAYPLKNDIQVDELSGVPKVVITGTSSKYNYYSFHLDSVLINYNDYKEVTVTLDDNGGSGGQGSVNCTYDEAMPASVTVPKRTGYRFDGYYLGNKQYYKSDGKRAFTNYDIKDDTTTLTAKWTLMEFNVICNDEGGTGGPGSTKATYSFPLPNLSSVPTKEGYTFKGYYGARVGGVMYFDVDGKGVRNFDNMGDTNVYARWEANKYISSFDPAPGTGGITSLEATYDSTLPNLSAEQIPTRASSDGHSYSFGGYWTEAPTNNPDGSQTPNGTQYYDENGKGLGIWKEAQNTTLYAYWTIDMTVTSNSYAGIWDGENHGISIYVESPSDTTIYYGTSEEACNSTNAESFTYSGSGDYTVFFEVKKDGYTTYKGNETVSIGKAESQYVTLPTAKALEYDGTDQELIEVGSADYGTMLYAVNTTGELPDDSEFSSSIPTGKNVGTYYVFYKTTGDSNHNPIEATLLKVVEIAMSEIDKTDIRNLNDEVVAYLKSIENDSRFTSIHEDLETVRSAVKEATIDDQNVTNEFVAEKLAELQQALSAAKVSVTEILIESIGTVSYPESEEAIEAAKDHFDNILSTEEREAVNASLIATLDDDFEDFTSAKEVVTLIENIPAPSTDKEYYDAVEAAKEAYDALKDSNPDAYALVNEAEDNDHEKTLTDNVEASAVIKTIEDIGTLTYNGGTNDSLDDIVAAEEAYAALKESNPDAAALVEKSNHDALVEARESYDEVEEVVASIENIGKVTHGGETDSKEAIDEAREAYDSLSDEEKALVDGYQETGKALDDAENVYEAMEKIDAIGEISYDTDTEEKIAKAREIYDSLTDDQKEQLGEEYKNLLVGGEETLSSMKQTSDILVVIFLIVASLFLIGGIAFFILLLLKRKKEKEEDEDGKKPAKAMSIAGILPFIVYASHYVDAPYMALYILIGVAVLVWAAVLVLFLLGKKGIGPFKKKDPSKAKAEEETKAEEKPVEEAPYDEPVKETAMKAEEQPANEEEDESVTVTDEKGNIFQIRFIKSFTAKLSQAPEETKKYYEELKNEVLSYKKTNSRVSWHYDSVNSGRNQVLRFAIRGKTLGVYLPLNVEEYADSKYKVEKVESKRFEDTPCLYRIKNDRRCAYAKELISVVAMKLGLEKGKEQHESYVIPHESTKALLAKCLIKEQKVAMQKKPEPVIVETKQTADGDEIIRTRDSSGTLFEIRYVKSFTAKLSQASKEVRDYYNLIKNHALSYKKANSRVSWHYDAINVGRDQVLKFAIRGKTLCVYYALDEADEKYKVETAKSKKFEDTPCLYRIKNDRRSVYAKELIDIVMRKVHAEKGKESSEDFTVPYESTKALLAKGLIKELKTRIKEDAKEPVAEEVHETISVEEADARMSDEAAAASIGVDAGSKKHEGKKGIINIDTINKNFHDGETVDLEALLAKKLIPQNVGYVKVLARGTINKRLNLDLQDYSIQAVKMVLLEGGTVKKAK